VALTPGGRVGDASPLARPGYKGKRKLSNYEREVAHALMRKRGMPKSRAIAIARGVINKAAATGRWGRGKKASAPVRAGAVASVAQRHSFSEPGSLDVALAVAAAHRVYRFRHGWVPVGGVAPKSRSKSRSKGRPKTRSARNGQSFTRSETSAQREQARRIAASMGLYGGGRNNRQRYSSKAPAADRRTPTSLHTITAGGWQFANPLVRAALAEAGGRGLIDLAPKWKHGWVPLNAEAAAIKAKRAKGYGGNVAELVTKAQRERNWRGQYHAPKTKGLVDDAAMEAKYREHVKSVDARLNEMSKTHAVENNPAYSHGRDEHGGILWNKERAALHRKLVRAEFRKQVRQGAQKGNHAIFLGGLPGAGKSSGLKKKFGDVEKQYVTVNPDLFKERLAHGGHIQHVEGMSALEASGLHHEESARMAEMLAEHAMKHGYNLIHDITMNNEKSITKRLAPLRERGYRAHAMFLDIPHPMSVESVTKRHRRGWFAQQNDATGTHIGQRLVPSGHINAGKSTKGSNSANRDAFDATKHLFDSYDLYDNNNYAMRLIDSKGGERARRAA
jgi:predicted ABC-type ATPase